MAVVLQGRRTERRVDAGTAAAAMKKPVWGVLLLLLLCVAALAAVDVAEATSRPGVSASRRGLWQQYVKINVCDSHTSFTYGCDPGQSCYDGQPCTTNAECCSYKCRKIRKYGYKKKCCGNVLGCY
ncbi:hypothetical protein KC19_10G048300 [Ceratodon purpureus]|uniref:WAP domain-containing protein n=1 Tax=Ceratodon purpureus TaxID=3225 RepID=A0A8T0GLV2_CERPU|nr:hypothetical protein KC19_10G048300 [Ceratodon purpureus]